MKRTHTLSNSFLVYGFIILSILIYIFGVFAVTHFVKESSQTGFLEAFSANVIPNTLGIICLFLAAPGYRFTKSLRLVELTNHKNGPFIVTLYSPFFMSDILPAEHQITLQNIEEVKQNKYFNNLVELRYKLNGTDKTVISFINPESVERLESS